MTQMYAVLHPKPVFYHLDINVVLEFRLSLEAEVERRSQDLSILANRLAALIDEQAKVSSYI